MHTGQDLYLDHETFYPKVSEIVRLWDDQQRVRREVEQQREMHWDEKFKHLLSVGISAQEAADATGLTLETIYKYRSKKSGRYVSEEHIRALEKYLIAKLKRIAKAAGYKVNRNPEHKEKKRKEESDKEYK